jgi:uncharacterized protein YidB (DUF937 family)
MGILDTLIGMRGGSGGMSPVTMGLLGLLAYKAVKGFGASSTTPTSGGMTIGSGGGGLGNNLGDILNNLGSGRGAGMGGSLGGILSGGLGDLFKQFQGAGKGDVADSWVGTGANKPITPDALGKVLAPEQIIFLMQHTGLSRNALLSGLSEHLPNAVDTLTPAGHAPSREELARMV